MVVDAAGKKREVRGLFGAVSEDEGETWRYKRLLTDDGPPRGIEGGGGGLFVLSRQNAEYQGYLSVCQSLDGVIHLISSRQHYAFNLAYLKTPQGAATPPLGVQECTETFSGAGADYDAPAWAQYKSYRGGFNGKGQYEIRSLARANGINRVIGAGSFEVNIALRNIRYHPPGKDTTPGVAIGFRDARTRRLFLRIERDKLRLEGMDEERATPIKFSSKEGVRPASPPREANVRFVYRSEESRWQIYYGLDGEPATRELPRSKEGLRFGKPFSEATTLYLLVDQGAADFDRCEVQALSDS